MDAEVPADLLPGQPTGIRRMTRADIPHIEALERASFPTPWSAETFARISENPGVELWVLADPGGDGVHGYAVMWCVVDQAELANIAVDAERRGAGEGGRLLDWLLVVAGTRGVARLFLEVRESNEAARRLYASRGFSEVGRRRGYYEKPREDALVLVRDLTPPPV